MDKKQPEVNQRQPVVTKEAKNKKNGESDELLSEVAKLLSQKA